VTVPKLKALTAAVVAAGALAGCAPAAVPAAAPPAAAPQAAAASAAPAGAVPAALRFQGKTLDGTAFDAATLAGKPTVLWFWAPWCATCASEAFSISDLQKEYAGRLNILGIGGLGGNKEMHEFVADLKVGAVPHLDDEAGVVWKKFGITQQATYVILDRTGKVVASSYLDDLQLTTKVKSLVA
jgi:thiol-disulfide isomerase/thioredoxin